MAKSVQQRAEVGGRTLCEVWRCTKRVAARFRSANARWILAQREASRCQWGCWIQHLFGWQHEGELRKIEQRGRGDGVGRVADGRFARLVLFGRAALCFAGLLAGARARQGAHLRESQAQHNEQRKKASHLTVLYGC
jgi:hypothetical protein